MEHDKKMLSKMGKKQSQAYEGYTSAYNVEILNYFNPELQPNNAGSAIKNNRFFF